MRGNTKASRARDALGWFLSFFYMTELSFRNGVVMEEKPRQKWRPCRQQVENAHYYYAANETESVVFSLSLSSTFSWAATRTVQLAFHIRAMDLDRLPSFARGWHCPL
jgi:hypothetical protein